MNKNIKKSKISNESQMKPFIVLGCQRSGTTLLSLVLNGHSKVCVPPELNFINSFCNDMTNDRFVMSFESIGIDEEELNKKLFNFIDETLKSYCKIVGKKGYGIKITGLFPYTILDDLFDNKCRFIAIVRHGLDVARSIEKNKFQCVSHYIQKGVPYDVAGVSHWVDVNKGLLDFEHRIGKRFKWIKYEELTNNKEKSIREMCKFLDLPFEDKMLNPYSHQHTYGFMDGKTLTYKRVSANTGNYKNWTVDQQYRLFQVGWRMFKRFGYDVDIKGIKTLKQDGKQRLVKE
jgi:hypothetical protein